MTKDSTRELHFTYGYHVENSSLNSTAEHECRRFFEYLDENIFSRFLGKDLGDVIVYVPSESASGIVSIFGKDSQRWQVVDHILSPQRKYSPTHISCDSGEDYSTIGGILKRNRGSGACLKRGFEGWISNVRKIQV